MEIFDVSLLDSAAYDSVGDILYHYSDRGQVNFRAGPIKHYSPVFTLSTKKANYEVELEKQLLFLRQRILNSLSTYDGALDSGSYSYVHDGLEIRFSSIPGQIYRSAPVFETIYDINGHSMEQVSIKVAMLFDLGKVNIRRKEMINTEAEEFAELNKNGTVSDGELIENRDKLEGVLMEDEIPQIASVAMEAKEAVVKQALQSPEGRVCLAQAMVEPIKAAYEHGNILMKLFHLEYENDLELAPAKEFDIWTVYGRGNSSHLVQLFPDQAFNCRYRVPTHEVAVNPGISIRDLKSDKKKFDLMDKMQINAVDGLIKQELVILIDLLYKLSDKFNLIKFPLSYEYLDFKLLDDIKKKNKIQLSNGHINILCPLSLECWLSGYDLAKGDNIFYYDSAVVGCDGDVIGYDNRVYVLPESNLAGRMVQTCDITILPADDPRRLMLGYVIYEHMGIVVMNTDLMWCLDLN